MTADLAPWLLEQIAEDEAPTFELIPYRCEPDCCAPAGWVGHRCLICGTEEFGGTVEAIAEIAEEHDERIHQRARVLAECEAKRRIVDEHAGGGGPFCDVCAEGIWDREDLLLPCPTLRLLALPYADRPGYREEWKP